MAKEVTVGSVDGGDEVGGGKWSRGQEKAFENALAMVADEYAEVEWWERISALVPGKSAAEVERHYQLLLEDLKGIETGRVPLPRYLNEASGDGRGGGKKGHGGEEGETGYCGSGGKGSKSELERRKGIAWTEEEHRLFLLGLEKYGKGDWRSISRNFVVTRTPTQVASHAQKYFIRLNSMNKERRRSSIHDITHANKEDVGIPPGPITAQTNGLEATPRKSSKESEP